MYRYQNGNVDCAIYEDGTAVRECNGDDPAPEFPCSIDIKITDYCDAGCKFCHESSTRIGKHAPYNTILRILDGLPPGVELAIGGGNPLSHPNLDSILVAMRERGLVANLTVFEDHATAASSRLHELQCRRLVHGIGISTKNIKWTWERLDMALNPPDDIYDDAGFWKGLEEVPIDCRVRLEHLVWHFIVGIHDPFQLVFDEPGTSGSILLLGYKQYGFGGGYKDRHNKAVAENIDAWRYWIPTILSRKYMPSVSFDNLALEQLDLKAILPPEIFEAYYMGDDGQFTMYVDAVCNTYAVSSTSERRPLGSMSAREAFGVLHHG